MEESGIPISQNWMTQEQILPISLKTFEFDPKLINSPKMLRELETQYKSKKNVLNKKEQDLEKPENNSRFHSFLNKFSSRCTYIYSCTYNSDYHTNCNVHVIWTIQSKSFSNGHSYAKNKSS